MTNDDEDTSREDDERRLSSASINITIGGPHFLIITGHPVELRADFLPFSPLFAMIFLYSLRMRIPSHINRKRKYSFLFLRNDTSVIVVQRNLFPSKSTEAASKEKKTRGGFAGVQYDFSRKRFNCVV